MHRTVPNFLNLKAACWCCCSSNL